MKVPKGWKTRPLGELLDVQNGYAFSSEAFSKDEGMPLIRIRDLKGGCKTEVRFKGEYNNSFVVNSGDFLIGMDGEFRCYVWSGDSALLNQRVCRLLNFSKEVCPEFIHYGINSHLKIIEEDTPFVTVRHLSAKRIKAIEFAYPPIAEQDRIVSRIKECLDRVDEIERLRTDGIAEAEATLPSLLNEAFINLPNDFDKVEIGHVAIETRYGTSKRCTANPGRTAILRIPNVAGGYVNFQDLKYCRLNEKENQKLALEVGDLLFVRTNGSRHLVGRCAIYEGNEENQIYGFASYLIRVRLDKNKIRPHFLAFFLNSTHGRSELDKRRRTSAGQFNINSENLRNIEMPLPPIDVQDQIIGFLSEQQAKVVQLQNSLRTAQEAESHLRDSILRKAFAGEL